MAVIRVGGGIVTQINVFTVPAGGQEAMIDHLTKAAQCAAEEEGWLSASLHRSLDGMRVVNYAQSASLEAAQAVIARLRREGFIDRNRAYGEAHPRALRSGLQPRTITRCARGGYFAVAGVLCAGAASGGASSLSRGTITFSSSSISKAPALA